MPPARVRSVRAPAAAYRSMSSCTRAACAAGTPMMRPTMPVGAITAMSAWTPSSAPRPIVIVRMPGFGFPAITSAAIVGRVVLVCRFISSCSRVDRRRQGALLLEPHFEIRHVLAQRLVLGAHAAQADVVPPEVAHAVDDRRRPPLHAREHAERHRLQHRHAGLRLDLHRDQEDVRHGHDEQQNTGAAADV